MNRKIVIRSAVAAALLIAMPSAAQNADRTFYSDKQQAAALEAASVKARASLQAFWASFDSATSKDSYNLKVAFKTRAGGSENIWVKDLNRNGGQISGVLNNAPAEIQGLSLGSKVTFTANQISDWGYMKNGKLFGHFTTRVLMSRASPEEQAALGKVLSPSPLE